MAESEDIMGKIYDANGNKMGLQAICDEIASIATKEQKEELLSAINKYDYKDSQMKLAHGILDMYKKIDSATEQGARLRKLLDNLMTKYQKSVATTSADDQSIYHNLICSLK